jgi:branched-chain amino acid transport system permease protein
MMGRRELVAVVGTAVLLAAVLGVAGNDYVLSVFNFIGLFAVAVMGLVIVLGYAGQIVLGHAGFMAIGAYASALLTLRAGWAPPIAILAAATLVAAAAWVAGKPILRLRGFYLALATMAFAIIVDSVLVGWTDLTEGPSGMVGIPPFSLAGFKIVGEWPNFLFITALVLVALALTLMIERSMAGVGLRALHRDEELAATLGVDVPTLKTAAFVLSAIYAGVAGACYAHYARFISPEVFGLHASFDLLLVAMLGGVGTPYGALIGAAILKFLPEALGAFRDYRLMVYGLVFILITFYFPNGVAGWVRDLLARRRRAVARAVAMPIARRAPASAPSAPAGRPLLVLEDVSRAFQGLQAVAAVSFEVRSGEITALIGPNGAGKSTIVNLVSGLLRPDHGRILFDGVDLARRAPWDIARAGVARTFQNVRLLGDLSVGENVLAGRCARSHLRLASTIGRLGRARREYEAGRAEARALLADVGLLDYEHRPASTLPFGSQRIIEIARALGTRPQLLLLDEPAAGLNDTETEALAHLLRSLVARGITILLIEHNMTLVQAVADAVVVVHHGQKLAAGNPDAVFRDPDVVDAYLGQALTPAVVTRAAG